MQCFDIVIVGGGLVGLSLALGLKKYNYSVALVEANNVPSKNHRLFALNESSVQFLKNLNIWDKLSSSAALIDEVHISSKGGFGSLRLKSKDVDLSALGFVIPAETIEKVLHEELFSLPFLTLLRPATLKSIEIIDNKTVLAIETHQHISHITGKIIIAADGTHSTLRSIFSFDTAMNDLTESALVTKVTLKNLHQQIAYERFTKLGTIAMLPLADNQYALIWTGKTNFIKTLLDSSSTEFLFLLQKTFGYRLGKFLEIAERYIYPLCSLNVKETLKENVFLLGNAAHTLHPVAAQGFNLALYEVAVLLEVLAQASENKNLLNAHFLKEVVKKIEAQKKFSVKINTFLVELLNHPVLLNASWPAIMSCDFFPSFRKKLIENFLGKKGWVPSLLLE